MLKKWCGKLIIRVFIFFEIAQKKAETFLIKKLVDMLQNSCKHSKINIFKILIFLLYPMRSMGESIGIGLEASSS